MVLAAEIVVVACDVELMVAGIELETGFVHMLLNSHLFLTEVTGGLAGHDFI
jgi:hypothetical protein